MPAKPPPSPGDAPLHGNDPGDADHLGVGGAEAREEASQPGESEGREKARQEEREQQEVSAQLSTPDIQAVLCVARDYAAKLGLLADEASAALVERSVLDTLFDGRDAWECARLNIITKTETANLVLARLLAALEVASGVQVDDWGGSQWTERMERALFRPQDL